MVRFVRQAEDDVGEEQARRLRRAVVGNLKRLRRVGRERGFDDLADGVPG